MKFTKVELRKIFRNITDYYYPNVKNTEAKGLKRKEYFDKMWNLMNKEFNIDTSYELFQIEFMKDNTSNLEFLRSFIILNSRIDLEFNISHIEQKANISILKKFLNKKKLTAIMDFMYQNISEYPLEKDLNI